MATYIVNGDRYDSIVSARASAVRRSGRRPMGETVPIYKGTALEGVVYRTENGYSYKVGRRTFQINTDGTIQRTPGNGKAKPSGPKVDLKILQDDIVDFAYHYMPNDVREEGGTLAYAKAVGNDLRNDPHHIYWWYYNIAFTLEQMGYPGKSSFPYFSERRIERMLKGMLQLMEAHDPHGYPKAQTTYDSLIGKKNSTGRHRTCPGQIRSAPTDTATLKFPPKTRSE